MDLSLIYNLNKHHDHVSNLPMLIVQRVIKSAILTLEVFASTDTT